MPQNGGTYTFTVRPEADLSTISAQVKTLSAEFQKLKLPKNMGENLAKDTEKITNLIKKYQDQLAKGTNNKADVKALSETEKEINRVFGHLMDEIKEVNNHPVMLKVDAQKLEELRTELKAAQDELKKGFELHLGGDANSFNTLLNGIGRAKSLQGFAKEAQDAFNTGDIEAYGAAIDKIINKINGFQPQTLKSIIKSLFPDKDVKNISETKELLDLIIPSLDNIKKKGTEAIGATEGLRDAARTSQQAFDGYKTEAIERGAKAFKTTEDNAKNAGKAVADLTHEETESAKATANMKGQMDQLKSSTEYFFSLRNMFSLLRRGIHQAVETVRELDAAMTETAVVTDFSVSDMWGMLPQYTAQANKLGATIKDVYDATTLYYQQGLDTNQAMGLANETLKMARIAGLEAAAATDAMTAALRGFNMEINETSAQRINDVYSEIAAKTASDTEELSTAMSKTASLAHSAGMTFEGTTAFLAQMIETTREAPENLGTAMKTIIARFQEMKKNPLEIVEVDGEEVSYNKIDEALQSIGVSLKDANGQFRDLDDVFLEISAKWDSLTQTQQRYIATTAAGSRQQSRFIAMMSNYERVTQLVEYANNSAGASQEQFEKTLDSFEAKVNKLKNAWQEYLMGIADNTIIKKGIDLLTGGLTKVNELMEKLSGNNTTAKSILSIATAFMGLKAGGKFINAAIGGLGGLIDPKSSFFKGFFGGGAVGKSTGQVSAQAQQISNPIVQAIHQLQAAVTGKAAVTNSESPVNSTILDYKTAKSDLKSYLKKESNFSLTDIYGKIGNLSDNHQKAILQQLPGLKLSLGKGLNFDFKNKDISKGAQDLVNAFGKEVSNGLNNKSLNTDDVVKIFGTAENFQQAMASKGDKYAKAAEEALFGQLGRQGYIDDVLAKGWASTEEGASILADKHAQKQFENFVGATKSDGADLANTIGGIGSAAVTAGQGIAQLGMQLSNAGFKEAGAMVTNLGYQISSLGQIASSAGSLIGKIAEKGGGSLIGGIGALVAAHPVITGILAVVTALGVAWGIHQKKVEEIHETAQKVKDDYAEINKTTTDNIATLQQYKDELADLSKGVDENGYNVSLSTDEYDRYLEIVDKIAEINPDIVEYYNAQGHAVLNLNSALEDTLDLEEKRQKEALRTYTSQTSLQALLDDRAENKSWRNYSTGVTYYNDKGQATGGDSLKGKTGAVITKLRDAGFDLNKLQTKYGINVDSLLKGESKAIIQFTKNQNKILHEAETSLASSWDSVGDGITEAFTDLGDSIKEFNEINQPIFEQLATWIGQDTRFQNLDTEQKGFVTTGLQSIIMEDMDAPTMRKEARKVVREIDKQFGKGSPYEDIMSRVKEAQEAFALDLDEQKYNKEIDGLIGELETLRDESENIGGAAGEALYNAYERQLALLKDQAGQSAHDIMEALNPLSDEIASAEGAFGKFQEQTSSDFSTASKNMKQFFDVLNSDEHKAGYGDKSYWLAAKEVFSEKALQGKMKPSDLTKMQEQIEPLFTDGAEGFNNFVDYIDKFKDNDIVKKFLYNDKGKLQFDFDDENIHEIAEALKLSDNSFTALVNKARQFAKIRFGNTEELREALSLSDTTVFGQSVNKNGEKSMYVNREQIIADAYSSGAINNPTEEADFIKELEQANIKTIPGPGSLDSKHFDQWKGEFEGTFKEWKDKFKEDVGITSKGSEGIKESIGVFDKMGYGKEDIFQYTKSLLGKKNVSAEEFNNLYDAYVEEQNLDPVTEGMNTIEATLEAIKSIIAGGNAASGDLNPENLQADKLQKATFGKENEWDTMADMFAHGFNEAGSKLSEQEYNANLETLTSYKQVAEDYLSDLREGLKTVDPNDKDKLLLYDKEINNILDYIKQIDKVIDSGEKVKEQRKDKEQQKQLERYQEIGEQRDAHQQGAGRNNEHSAENIEKTITWKNQYDGSDVEKEANKTKEHIEDKPAVIEGQVKFEGVDKAASTATSGKDATLQVGADTTPAVQAVSAEKAKFESEQSSMPVLADVDRHEVDSVISTIETARYVDIYPNFLGEWVKTIRIKAEKEAARGLNNHISSAGFYAGSMAKGSKGGTLGPKGKGGTTLTGEKGFEIAWLPSEQRSMILGARGPQLVDLPPDAVVWNHEQSKKIVKQKGIPAGSLSDVESEEITKWEETTTNNGQTTTKKKITKKKSSKSDKDKNSKTPHTNWLQVEIDRYNIGQKINKITEKIEKNAKKIDDSLSKIGTTYNKISKNVDTEISLINDNIKYQQELQKSYNRGLRNLVNGSRSLWVSLQTKNGKGEWESKEELIDTSKYVTREKDGTYSINRNKIANDYSLRPNQEAIFNALQSEIDKLTNGANSAAQAIADAQQQIKDITDQVKEAFFAWENELTKIYDLTQQISDADARRTRFASENGLLMAQIGAGYESAASAGRRLIQVQKQDTQLIKERVKLTQEDIAAKREQLSRDVSSKDEKEIWQSIKQRNEKKKAQGKELTTKEIAQEEAAKDDYLAAKYTNKYVKRTRQADGSYKFDFNEEKLERDKRSGKINKETYDAIKEGFDTMVESNEAYQQSISDGFDYLAEIYEQYGEYVKTMADLESDLIDAYEKAAQKEVQKLESLNSSLTASFKKVIDQVKRNIDNRRRQEDNLKTEGDIAQKQQRLAMLRANTSGGNQVEAAQLEKEIGDAQTQYGRTLEDQMLANMQQQADQAAQQRQEQIDLAKQQIEYNKEAGIYAARADKLLEDVKGNATQIQSVLDVTKDQTAGKWGDEVWKAEVQTKIADGITASAGITDLKTQLSNNSSAINTLADTLTNLNRKGTKPKKKKPKKNHPKKEEPQKEKPEKEKPEKEEPQKEEPEKNEPSLLKVTTSVKQQVAAALWRDAVGLGWGNGKTRHNRLASVFGPKNANAIQAIVNKGSNKQVPYKKGYDYKTQKKKKYKKYLSGGLADSTGPAWLDGTTSKPELVLNAQDTKNFIALKDILSGVMHDISHISSSEVTNAPTEININVNVDKVTSDYDVDKLAKRLKNDIVKDMNYRNVTQVRNFR